MIAAVVFDFDGVIIESSDIKTEAFRRLFEYERTHVADIVELHLNHEGLSRYEKFEMIYKNILKRPLSSSEASELGRRFSDLVFAELLRCPFVPGATKLLQQLQSEHPLYIASGTPEEELLRIVEARELSGYFTGVYGSPALKAELLDRVARSLKISPKEVLFIGDAMTDLEGALEVGAPFVGRIHSGRPNPFAAYSVPVVTNLLALYRKWDQLLASLSNQLQPA